MSGAVWQRSGDRRAGWWPELVRARFNPAIPVSNRHHDELARWRVRQRARAAALVG